MVISIVHSFYISLRTLKNYNHWKRKHTLHLNKHSKDKVTYQRGDSPVLGVVICVRIDAFKLERWRRLLRVPWTLRRSNQSVLKELNHECSLEGLMLKLKLQYFGHLMQRANSLEKTLMLGNIEGKRRRGWQRDDTVGWCHQLNGREFEQTQGDSEGQGSRACCPRGCKESDTT